MKVALMMVVGLVLLSGCTRVIDVAGTDWGRADTSLQQETWDEVACARDTEGAGDLLYTFVVGGIADAIVVPLEDARRGAAYDRCMVGKGYSPVASNPR